MQALFGHLCVCPLAEEVSKYMTYLFITWLIVGLWNPLIGWYSKTLPYCWRKAKRRFHCFQCFQYSGTSCFSTKVIFFTMKHKRYYQQEQFKSERCIAYLSIMQAVQANDPSWIEMVVMPLFDSNAFGINNHSSSCMDNCKKHFSNLKPTKVAHLPRK